MLRFLFPTAIIVTITAALYGNDHPLQLLLHYYYENNIFGSGLMLLFNEWGYLGPVAAPDMWMPLYSINNSRSKPDGYC